MQHKYTYSHIHSFMIIFYITNGKYSRAITVLFVDIIKFNTDNILTIQEKFYVYTLYILEFLDLYYFCYGDGFLFVFIFIYIYFHTIQLLYTCEFRYSRRCRFISPLSSRGSTRTYIEDEKKRAS